MWFPDVDDSAIPSTHTHTHTHTHAHTRTHTHTHTHTLSLFQNAVHAHLHLEHHHCKDFITHVKLFLSCIYCRSFTFYSVFVLDISKSKFGISLLSVNRCTPGEGEISLPASRVAWRRLTRWCRNMWWCIVCVCLLWSQAAAVTQKTALNIVAIWGSFPFNDADTLLRFVQIKPVVRKRQISLAPAVATRM